MRPAVTLICRQSRPGNHSVENLFSTIKPHLQKQFQCDEVKLPCSGLRFLDLLSNILYAIRFSKGIKHVTGDTNYIALFLPGKVVLTVLDCGLLLEMRGLKRFLYKHFWFTLPCWRASRVTVISEATKQSLIREIGQLGEKLSVIDCCQAIAISKSVRPRSSERLRILQIGSGRHKNLDTLIEAVRGMQCELHIVGKISDGDRESLLRYEIAYVNEFNVSSERLISIYGECDLLFFASRHEGFGLPILEAQSAGIPVITSNVYSMPHVAGDGAILVDPESSDQVREAINKIRYDSEFRERLIENGWSNIQRFQPEKIADRYCELYNELCNGRSVTE